MSNSDECYEDQKSEERAWGMPGMGNESAV